MLDLRVDAVVAVERDQLHTHLPWPGVALPRLEPP